MNLRIRNYPPKFWLQLHKHAIDLLLPPPSRKPRRPPRNKIKNCLTSLSPHIQKFIYCGAIDKRKGEIRASKFPLTIEQFNITKSLCLTRQYQPVVLLEEELKLEYNFIHKSYVRGIQNIQFRLQTQKSIVPGQYPILLLRIRYHQKAPILHQ
ncbi:unnamed protein product [Rotaria sordida]|uniref:Uncharacterized protein n=1 Tax=Rotaria sordida TaxID=392033 RepID=A0A815T6R2_9BILA|nr:unnamed protein product [Rotaria sordida]CAF1613785.1 unnamed protein product [Rotaria sordida]